MPMVEEKHAAIIRQRHLVTDLKKTVRILLLLLLFLFVIFYLQGLVFL